MSHILFISHARGIHGAEAVMVQAIKACAARGARVTVVVPSIVPDEGMEKALQGIRNVQELPLPYRAGGVDLLRTRLVRLYNLWTLRQLERYVEQERVTTIYSNTTITILGAELAKRTHVRHIWHWHEPVDERFGWHFTLKEYFCSLIEVTDKIICISQHQKAEWSKELDRMLTNAQVVYNPIKPIRFTPDRGTLRHAICIGFIGHFEERKNLPMLMQAFVDIHDTMPDVRLLLCGAKNEYDRMYVEQMTDLREPVVSIMEQTSEVEQFYNRIDILVLPSWRETMPLVVLEAMQAGICVLQTDQSGMTEILEAGKETLFFSPNRLEELERLLMLCMDTEYRRTIAKAGQEKALQLVNNQQFDRQIQTLLCA